MNWDNLYAVMLVILFFMLGFYGHDAAAEDWHESRDCMVKNMLMEARDQGLDGMTAVAQVTMNRVKSKRFPNTVCDVVYQRNQFSWTIMEDKMTPLNSNVELKLIHFAHLIAGEVLDGYSKDIVGGSLWYHRDDVKPYWAKEYTVVAQVGRHIFYN